MTIAARLRMLEQRLVSGGCPDCADWPVFVLDVPGRPEPPQDHCPRRGRAREGVFSISIEVVPDRDERTDEASGPRHANDLA